MATSYRLQYGETTGVWQRSGGGSALVLNRPRCRVTLSVLKLGVTYHFRVIAENEAGIDDGPDGTFTTLASASIDGESPRRDSERSDATRPDQPSGQWHQLLLPVRHQSCQAKPAECTDVPASPEDIGEGEADVAKYHRADRP